MLLTDKQIELIKKITKTLTKDDSIVHMNKQVLVIESTLPFTNTCVIHLTNNNEPWNDNFITISFETLQSIIKLGSNNIEIKFSDDTTILEVSCGSRKISISNFSSGTKPNILEYESLEGEVVASRAINSNLDSIISTLSQNFPGIEVLANIDGLFVIDNRAYSTNRTSLLVSNIYGNIANFFLPSRLCGFFSYADFLSLHKADNGEKMFIVGENYKIIFPSDITSVVEGTQLTFENVINSCIGENKTSLELDMNKLLDVIDVKIIKSFGPQEITLAITNNGTKIKFESKDGIAFEGDLLELRSDPIDLVFRADEFAKILNLFEDYVQPSLIYDDNEKAAISSNDMTFITKLA